jgi:hypothetical protein
MSGHLDRFRTAGVGIARAIVIDGLLLQFSASFDQAGPMHCIRDEFIFRALLPGGLRIEPKQFAHLRRTDRYIVLPAEGLFGNRHDLVAMALLISMP